MKLLKLCLMTLIFIFSLGQSGCDEDGDGYAAPDDCDDGNPFIHPAASEFVGTDSAGQPKPDGQDNDCDGKVDEHSAYFDDDGDGYCESTTLSCRSQDGVTFLQGDCDDGQSLAHPGAEEDCDGVDNDCDGRIDESPECRKEAAVCGYAPMATFCEGPSDCPDEGVCLDGRCHSVVLCDAVSGYPQGNQGDFDELPRCEEHGDCPWGSACEGGSCVSECDSATPCGGDLRCDSRGQCVECEVDAHCGSGLCGEDHRCTVACTQDDDCAAGESCDAAGRCASGPTNVPTTAPEHVPVTLTLGDCPGEEMVAGGGLVLDAGHPSESVCVSLPEGAEGSHPVLVGISSFEGAPPVDLTLPEGIGEAVPGGFSLDLAPGGDGVSIKISIGEGFVLDHRGAVVVIRALTQSDEDTVGVEIRGSVGGAYRGQLNFEGARPSEPFSLILEPLGEGDGRGVVLASGSLMALEDLRAEVEQTGEGITLRWYECMAEGDYALGGEAEAALEGGAFLPRALCRELTLTGQVDRGPGGDAAPIFAGTFEERLRGLLPGGSQAVLTSSGRFQLGVSPSLTDVYARELAALAHGDGVFETYEAARGDAAERFASLRVSQEGYDDTCLAFAVSASAAGAACLFEGEGPSCPHKTAEGEAISAYPLGAFLAGVGDQAGEAFATERFGSEGVCRVELDLYFETNPEVVEGVSAVPYGAAPAMGGSCAGGEAPYAVGDPGFAPCCVEPNRLHCSAEAYASAITRIPSDLETASREIFSPLTAQLGAHTFDLQARRQAQKQAELDYSANFGAPGSGVPTLDDRAVQEAAALAALRPALGLLVDPTILGGLMALDPDALAPCAAGPCPFSAFASQWRSSSAAHLDALADLVGTWRMLGAPTLEAQMKWAAYVTWLHGIYGETLAQLPGATLAAEAVEIPDTQSASTEVIEEVVAALQGLNPWGYPEGYVPNPTRDDGDFASRLESAQEAIDFAHYMEEIAMIAYTGAEGSREAIEDEIWAQILKRRERRQVLCGGPIPSASVEPNGWERCSEDGEGLFLEKLDALDLRGAARDQAAQVVVNHLERMKKKRAVAQEAITRLRALIASFHVQYADVIEDMAEMEADFAEGWKTALEDHLADKAELRAKLEAGYAELEYQVQTQRNALYSESYEDLQGRCDEMEGTITEAFEGAGFRVSDACGSTESWLSDLQASAERMEEGQTKRRLRSFRKWPIATITAAIIDSNTTNFGEPGGPVLGEGVRQWCGDALHTVDDLVDPLEDYALSEAEFKCYESKVALAKLHQKELLEQSWQREKEMLEDAFEEGDDALDAWYQYRLGMMQAAMARQQEVLAIENEREQKAQWITNEIITLREEFMGEWEIDLLHKEDLLGELRVEDLAASQALDQTRRILEEARRLEDEEARLLAQLDSGMIDPAFSPMETSHLIDMEAAIASAQAQTWLALRSFEFYTGAPFSQRATLDRAVSAHQLASFAECLRVSQSNYDEAFGTPQTNGDHILSAREALGLDVPAVDQITGVTLTPEERFSTWLTQGGHWSWNPRHTPGAMDLRVRIPLPESLWSGELCGEVMGSITALVECEGCSREGELELRLEVDPRLSSMHTCDDGRFEQMSSPPKDADGWGQPEGWAARARAVTVQDTSTPAAWDRASPSEGLAGLYAIVPWIDVFIISPDASTYNLGMITERITDIKLKLGYDYLFNQSWENYREAECLDPGILWGAGLGSD